MPRPSVLLRVLLVLALSLTGRPLLAQGSAYIPLDDPALQLFEHLVARGAVTDPSPFVRPIRRIDAVAALRGATGDSATVRYLLTQWNHPDSLWEARVTLGGESFTTARLDQLHPAGIGGTRMRGDVRLSASLGRLIMVTRPTIDERASLDPDWPGLRADPNEVCCRWRFPEAYLSWQPGTFRLYYGAVGRNWGPVGLAGIAMSDIAYARQEIGLEVATRDLQMLSTINQLQDVKASNGETVHRYHVASRVGLRLGSRLHVAGWQTAIIQGNDRALEGPFRNPLMLLPLANQYGMGDVRNNVMVGVHAQYRLPGAITLQGEAALDDLMLHNRERYPDRYAFTLMATGPAPMGTAFRVFYTRASALAFRTTNPDENFTERGVGLGRGFADNDQVTAGVTRPVTPSLVGGLDLTFLRQGQGRLTDPYDAILPMKGIFLGTVERTLRLAGRIHGTLGVLAVQGEVGLSHLTNAEHRAGRTLNRMEGRLSAQLRVGTSGKFR